MKKLKLILSLVLISLSIIACAVMIHFSNENFVEDVFLGSDIEDSVDEYLINQGKVRYSPQDLGVWLIENYDTDFEKDSESLEKALTEIEKSVFSCIFIKSEYFSSPFEESAYGENLEKIKNLTSLLKEKNKKVYIEMSLDFQQEAFEEISLICDGVILKDNEALSAERLNHSLSKAVKYIGGAESETKTIISLSFDFDISKLNKKSVDGVCATLDKETDLQTLSLWGKTFNVSDSDFICSIDINSTAFSKESEMLPLKLLYEANKCESLSAACFTSLKGVKKNRGSSFAVVKEFISDGIVPEIALRELNVTGFDGTTVYTSDFSIEAEICGSGLFPVYLDGKEISLGEKGSKKITFNLTEGENVFAFTQCGKTVEYKVNMTFEGDIIRAVIPAETLTVQPKEKVNVIVIAYSGADITVKLGTREYEAKCEEISGAGYAAFSAKITMPETREEISSLGMITVIGNAGERSIQQKGAMIVCGEEMTTTEVIPTEKEETTTAMQLGNFVQELIDDKYEYTTRAYTTLPAITQYTTQAPVYETFTGTQMCVIAKNYADTRPLVYNDDTYVPSYSSLVGGTMDYVIAKSSAYNSTENETVYFYELASGRKVRCDQVQLLNVPDPGSNSLEILSCSGENGSLTIRLKTDWKVPYAITHTPQNYYSAYGGKYNLSYFNANYIQIEFFHTSAVKGTMDISGSNVVSSADWSAAESEGKVILTMPLQSLGKYYGTTVEYDENGYMVITVHNNPQTLQGAVILLDPGHGGEDPGALGIGGQVYESDVNLAVAYATRDALEAKGATVYLTRQGNETLSLEERKNVAYSLKPDLYVSIHSNGSEKSSEIGTSVYYYKSFSQPLAENIYNEMIGVFKNNLYYGQQELYDELSDGARYYPFSVARMDGCPSVLIETGFMTNDNECYKLIQSNTHSLFGQAIANGIEKTVSG